MNWRHEGVEYPVLEIRRFSQDGQEWLQGTIPAAPRFPLLFRIEGEELVRSSTDEASVVLARRFAADLRERAIVVDGRPLFPVATVPLDEEEFVVALDLDAGAPLVWGPRGRVEARRARAVLAAFHLASLPEDSIEEALARRAQRALDAARAHAVKLSGAIAHDDAQQAYVELTRAIEEAEERLRGRD